MSRIEYSWQAALQQCLLPLPRSTQPTRISMFDLSAIHRSLRNAGLCTGVSAPNTPAVCFKIGRFTLTQSVAVDVPHPLTLRGNGRRFSVIVIGI
jgi:hypothetical protein